MEALADKLFGPASLRKGAPSNTAARVLGGDTIHALCKLPLVGGFLTKKAGGHLSAPVMRAHKRRWLTARSLYLRDFRVFSNRNAGAVLMEWRMDEQDQRAK